MVTIEYALAYNEVLEILKHISKEQYNKIPTNMIQMFKKNASGNNKFVYNPQKRLQEQNVSEIARIIIAILFRDYWATTKQKSKILSVQNNKRERIKQEKYNPEKVFNQRQKIEIIEKNTKNKDVAMIEYKDSLLKRILNKIKKLFHI